MAGGKPLSWKWKLTIGFVVAFGLSLIVAFTPWGYQIMRSGLEKAYENCPPEERREHWSADWWMRLAFWEGWICGRKDVAQQMYLELIGIAPNSSNGQSFQDTYELQSQSKWNGGFYDGKTKKGWGPCHPRACEAYYNYLELEAPYTSSQQIHKLASFYPVLFVTIYMREARSTLPHPKFYVYWSRTRVERYRDPKFGMWMTPPARPANYEAADE
jgi:hypothetical protein